MHNYAPTKSTWYLRGKIHLQMLSLYCQMYKTIIIIASSVSAFITFATRTFQKWKTNLTLKGHNSALNIYFLTICLKYIDKLQNTMNMKCNENKMPYIIVNNSKQKRQT